MKKFSDTATEDGVADTIPFAADRKEWKVTYDEQWFLRKQVHDPASTRHLINVAFSLSGNLDIEKLERSLRQLLLKHRVLRSVYHQDATGNFIRTLKDVPEVVLQHIRCEKDKVLEEIRKRNVPFDLAEGPLYRFFLFETAAGQYVMYSALFHSVIDGPGVQILLKDIADMYSDRTEESSEKTPDFLDFAEWRETNPRYRTDQEFYRRMFDDGFKINKMPWRVPLQEAMPCDGVARSRFEITPLENGARHHRVFLFSAFISALGLALGKYCRSDDVVLCLVMNARITNAAIKKTIRKTVGMFADRFPIRLQWQNDQSLSGFLKATNDRFIEILHHQSCSGRKWMKETSHDFDPDLTPIVNLNFSREVPAIPFQELRIEPFPIPPLGAMPEVQSMLGILHQTATNLNASFMYPTYYFDTGSVEGMNEDFSRILRKIAECNDIPLAEL